jgi:large subunit ribosomal protein L35
MVMLTTSSTGDMNKPIYRYLADKKWRAYKRKVLMQRITTMNVIPDVLPHIDPVTDVNVTFNGRAIPHGDFVDSGRSEHPPTVKIQTFDKGEKLVTIVAVDADVPDVAKDGFTYRCHGIWTNLPVSPTINSITINNLPKKNTGLPWLPPFAQRGSPYHRISLFVLKQPNGKELETANIEETIQRDGFILRSFVTKHKLEPIGVTMFRSLWDENTAAVMHRSKIPGADIVFKREKPQKLPEKYNRKDGARYRGFR